MNTSRLCNSVIWQNNVDTMSVLSNTPDMVEHELTAQCSHWLGCTINCLQNISYTDITEACNMNNKFKDYRFCALVLCGIDKKQLALLY